MNRHDDIRTITVSGSKLLDRVVSILNQARANVIKAVNSNMVIAYWLIGREIVQELQHGDQRAEYGKQVIETLSRELNARYGKGFSQPISNISDYFTRPMQIGNPSFVTRRVTNLKKATHPARAPGAGRRCHHRTQRLCG